MNQVQLPVWSSMVIFCLQSPFTTWTALVSRDCNRGQSKSSFSILSLTSCFRNERKQVNQSINEGKKRKLMMEAYLFHFRHVYYKALKIRLPGRDPERCYEHAGTFGMSTNPAL